MQPTTYRIPKLTDRELVTALGKISVAVAPYRQLRLHVQIPPYGDDINVAGPEPENDNRFENVFAQHSRVISSLYLQDASSGSTAVRVSRKADQTHDQVTIEIDWLANLSGDHRRTATALFPTLSGSVQSELRCDEVTASLTGSGDTEWNRYRASQMQVLMALQQTGQRVIVDSAQEMERFRSEQMRKIEELREKIEAEGKELRETLNAEHDTRLAEVLAKEKDLDQRLAAFETKESKYVARQRASEQLGQLREWLKNSSLTPETVRKRTTVFCGYIVAIVATGGIAGWITYENTQILKSVGESLPSIPWWQWAALTLKSLVPLAVFTTFLIYFIRWEGAWARQHADEELRTRARMVDIGRSTWLMEAVRDAQVPPELLRELSRNLFADPTGMIFSDSHPKPLHEVVGQQLGLVKLKTPEGTEFEVRSKGTNK